MADVFAPESLPVEPEVEMVAPQGPAGPAGLPGFGIPAPPTAGQLLAEMRPEPEIEPAISPRERLLLTPKVLKPTPPQPPAPPDVPDDVRKSNSFAQNVNIAARLAQYRETDPSADPDAVWRKLAANPDIVRGRPGKLLGKLLAGSELPEEDWDELKATIGGIAPAIEQVDDDLKVGKGELSSIYGQPDGVWLTLDYDETESSEDLPASLTGKPSKTLPIAALEWPAKDLSAFVGPTDVVYAANPTEQTDFQLRNLRPGPLGDDGIPRWVPVEPMPVRSHREVEATALTEPGTVIDSYVTKDAYPGTKGGDWIVWDVPEAVGPQAWKAPEWMQGRAERVNAGVATQQPKYALQPVQKADIVDQWTLDERLDDTSWAVFQAQGDPNSTSHLVSRLKRQGFEPIELEGGERRAWLAFGVDPSDAEQLSPKRPVFTNDGVITSGDEPEPQQWTFKAGSGPVTLESRPGITAGAIPRTQKRSDRWAFKVDPDQAKRIARFADDLEAVGALNLSVYSREGSIDGFTGAREYLYHDGVSLRAVRTASSHVGDPNAIPVHVRSTAGLPADRPQVSRQAINTDLVPFQESGRSVTIETGEDLEQATQQAAILAAVYGPDKVRVNSPNGRLRFHQPD